MPKKISDETIQLIKKLYDENLPVIKIARKVKVSYQTIWECTKAKERGFGSYREYRKDLVKQKGFASFIEYQNHLARQRGFGAYSKYQNYLAKQKQKRPENRELSDLIKRSLKKLGKNQSWLASQIDVSRESVSKYAQGKRTPNREKLKRLFSALDVPYRTLDDLLEDNY